MTLLGDPQRGALIAQQIRDALPDHLPPSPGASPATLLSRRTLALICVPPMTDHSTTRLLWRAQATAEPGCCPDLTHAEALALDRQLAALADATERTDPWTAALTTGDHR